MTDFTIRSDSVDVEQIMGRIRARIREKRGVDYTEQDLQELAAVKLEKFLDPEGVRSDLLAEFKKASSRPPIAPPAPLEPLPEPPPNYTFEADTIYETHRSLLRWTRRLLGPILKLFFNPNTLIKAIHDQTRINAAQELVNARTARIEAQILKRAYDVDRLRADREILTYEVLHNLVVELTRAGIEIKNLKMRVESLSSRLDFDERRARALEGVVEYRKEAPPPKVVAAAPADAALETEPAGEPQPTPGGEQPRGRRRRRRRGRRGGRRGPTTGADPTGSSGPAPEAHPPSSEPEASSTAPAAAESERAISKTSRSALHDDLEDHEADDPGDR
ncbi:MAG: hypothetical protein HYZ58_02740 [Acidobacteria bacterium]|nr:hypothetical protein [Acidobacteriota bacterium]